MHALIDYESLYGTNRVIARAVAAGIGADATVTTDADIDLLVIGGPKHKANLPRSATRAEAAADSGGALHPDERGLREWLGELQLARRGQAPAVWDTRMVTPRILDTFDRSARTIIKQARRSGARLVSEPGH